MYTIGGMIMTIAGLSTNISTSGITNDIQIAMLKKNLDTVETAGADGSIRYTRTWSEY